MSPRTPLRALTLASTLSLVSLALAACGGAVPEPVAPPPPPPEPAVAPPPKPAVAEAPAPAKAEPCATVDACAKEARERAERHEVPALREALSRACHMGSMPHCAEGGAAWLAEPADKARALALYAHACGERAQDPDACAEVVALRTAAGEAPTALMREAEGACKGGARDDAAKRSRAAACLKLAEARVKGGAAPSDSAVARAHHQACELGSDEGCKAEKANAKPELLEGANLHVDGISGNGMKLDEVACKVSGLGGMFGAMTVIASFSPRKGRLDACAKKKTEVVVKWVGKGGAMTDIHASGGPAPVNACVERALAGSKVALGGPCAARFQVH